MSDYKTKKHRIATARLVHVISDRTGISGIHVSRFGNRITRQPVPEDPVLQKLLHTRGPLARANQSRKRKPSMPKMPWDEETSRQPSDGDQQET